MQKPDPREACIVTDRPEELPTGLDAYLVSKRHRMMTDLMLMAIACDLTRVFNMFYASAFSATTKPGYDKPHHTATHEEAVDPRQQCQPNVSWFTPVVIMFEPEAGGWSGSATNRSFVPAPKSAIVRDQNPSFGGRPPGVKCRM